ncbi:MAG: phosphoribosylamine--glycine ligase [Pseudomonadota bacterium]
MNVLLIGGGGREHALAWAMSASPLLDTLICAPGNAGIAQIAECAPLDASDHAAVIDFCRKREIEFVVIGPEQPLVDGLADALDAAAIKVFGPSAAAAQLEGSKGFTKDFCAEFNIPTAAYERFTEAAPAHAYIADHALPVVIKADGLAAGKGVIIAETRDEASAAIDQCFDGAFGKAGAEVVVEAFLVGEEASFFVLVDGETVLPLATAQDHKRAHDGDTGPNTGGMGAYSPAPVMTEEIVAQTMERIIHPTAKGMVARGTPFRGVFYAGLMITEAGPELIEYNVRFGDPECQALMVRLKSDLLTALLATVEGTLDQINLRWHDEPSVMLVYAANGYPGTYEKGTEIRGLEAAAAHDDIEIFHAGTTRDDDGTWRASGGRVLGITARGATVAEARHRAYTAANDIAWPDGFYRHDIAWRALEREKTRDDDNRPA